MELQPSSRLPSSGRPARGGVEERRDCLTELVEAGLLHGEVPGVVEQDGAGGRGYSVGEPHPERARGPALLRRADTQARAAAQLPGSARGRGPGCLRWRWRRTALQFNRAGGRRGAPGGRTRPGSTRPRNAAPARAGNAGRAESRPARPALHGERSGSSRAGAS